MEETIFDALLRYLRIRKVESTVLKYKRCILLDIGCGWDAKLLTSLQSNFEQGIGIDFKTSKIKTFQYTIENTLPFENNSFDVVTMLAVLEHLSNPLDIVREIQRVLKPDGSLILTVPSRYSKPVLEFLAYKLKIIDENEIRDHKKYYNYEDLIELVKKVDGLEIITHKYFQLGMNNFCIVKPVIDSMNGSGFLLLGNSARSQ